MNPEREEDEGPRTFVEDGITFLSKEELDAYREQTILLAWEEYVYV